MKLCRRVFIAAQAGLASQREYWRRRDKGGRGGGEINIGGSFFFCNV